MKQDNYQVIARRFRPSTFSEVKGQSAIVTTLQNAIRLKRTAHAYLFCGTRGTGKTTLARIFAKALNCEQLSTTIEPCNACSSCKEINSGSSLDILEIDGASNRGIDDIRKINETVGYASSSGGYKVFIIDEVHMLTKEAFNALLKTLEEPPSKVKFIFATTEVHKVLPTILSRCQRFNLNRISFETIIEKLKSIAETLQVNIEDRALHYIAVSANGGLRDAESLFDQIIAFSSEEITYESVCKILGLMPKERFFQLSKAGKEHNLAFAFELSNELFTTGKDLSYFMDTLIEHFRNLLLIKVTGDITHLHLDSTKEKDEYLEVAKLYTEEQCLTIIEHLIEGTKEMKTTSSQQILLESMLCTVIRSHHRIQIGELVQKLVDLEKRLHSSSKEVPLPPPVKKKSEVKKKASPSSLSQSLSDREKQRLDTILQFAAIELEGTIDFKTSNT